MDDYQVCFVTIPMTSRVNGVHRPYPMTSRVNGVHRP